MQTYFEKFGYKEKGERKGKTSILIGWKESALREQDVVLVLS